MATLLELDALQAHEAPSILLPVVLFQALQAGHGRSHSSRPDLTVAWSVGPDGRLACNWHASTEPLPD